MSWQFVALPSGLNLTPIVLSCTLWILILHLRVQDCSDILAYLEDFLFNNSTAGEYQVTLGPNLSYVLRV